jgi:hypothetical protein
MHPRRMGADRCSSSSADPGRCGQIWPCFHRIGRIILHSSSDATSLKLHGPARVTLLGRCASCQIRPPLPPKLSGMGGAFSFHRSFFEVLGAAIIAGTVQACDVS